MRLTQFTDYSLRVLIHLASRKSDELTNIKDIAQQYNISKNHLMKVIYNLGKLGYIETIRGRNGGIRLSKCPKTINLAEVVQATEDGFNLVECFEDKDKCVITDFCSLRHVLNRALKEFLVFLSDYTLEDVVRNNQKLMEYFEVTKK
jgi:Rrf2 family transcriptional regulator, nitric oxide-sensitive transcriptional repressor